MKVLNFMIVSSLVVSFVMGNDTYPNNRFLVSFHDVPSNVNTWTTKSGFLMTGNQEVDRYRTVFLDITDLQSEPSNIVLTEGYLGISKPGRRSTVQSYAFGSSFPALNLNGNLLYISSFWDGLYTFEITPQGIENTFVLEETSQSPQRQIPIDNNYLYAYSGSDYFHAFSLSDPQHPELIPNTFSPGLSDPQVFAAANGYVFQAANHPFGGEGFMVDVFQVIDFRTPSAPQILYTYRATNGYNGIQVVPGNEPYIVTSGPMSQVWDITAPENPVITDSIGLGAMRDIQVWNDMIVSRSDSALAFYSIDEAGRLNDESSLYSGTIDNIPFSLLAAGDQLIACSDDNQVYVYQGQAGAPPTLVYVWHRPSVTGLAVNQDYLVATTLDSLYVLSSLVGNGKEPIGMPGSFQLNSIYPNPFNSQTTIQFSLPRSGELSLRIYDALGREVVTLLNRDGLNGGRHQIVWNSRSTASGVYFVKVEFEGKTRVGKMILMK